MCICVIPWTWTHVGPANVVVRQSHDTVQYSTTPGRIAEVSLGGRDWVCISARRRYLRCSGFDARSGLHHRPPLPETVSSAEWVPLDRPIPLTRQPHCSRARPSARSAVARRCLGVRRRPMANGCTAWWRGLLLPATCTSRSGGSRTPARAPSRWPTRQAVGLARPTCRSVPRGGRDGIFVSAAAVVRGRRVSRRRVRPAGVSPPTPSRVPLFFCLACCHCLFPHRRRCQVPEPRLGLVLEAGAPPPLTPLDRWGHFPSGECAPPPPVRVRARRRSGGGLPVACSCRRTRTGRRREVCMLLSLRTFC